MKGEPRESFMATPIYSVRGLVKEYEEKVLTAKHGEKLVVYLLDQELVRRQAVTVGRELGTEIEILGGVSPGDRVVVSPEGELEPGRRAVARDR